MSSENPTQDKSHRNLKERVQRRYNPYTLKDTRGSSSDGSTRTKTLTKHLLQTLTEDSNPITHSDIGLRSGQFLYSLRRAKRLTLDDVRQIMSSRLLLVTRSQRVQLTGELMQRNATQSSRSNEKRQ